MRQLWLVCGTKNETRPRDFMATKEPNGKPPTAAEIARLRQESGWLEIAAQLAPEVFGSKVSSGPKPGDGVKVATTDLTGLRKFNLR